MANCRNCGGVSCIRNGRCVRCGAPFGYVWVDERVVIEQQCSRRASPTECANIRREIAAFEQQHTKVEKQIMRIHTIYGAGTEDDLNDAIRSRIGIEEEIHQLKRRYNETCAR